MSEFQTASVADLQRMLEEAQAAQSNEVATKGRDLFSHLVDTQEVVKSAKSPWHGFSVSSEVTVEGRKFGVKIVMTDVEQTETAREADKAVAQAEREAAKINAERAKLKERLVKLGVEVDLD